MDSLPLYNPEDYGFTPKRPEVFDSSMVNDFLSCPSKFYLRHVLGLRPSGPEPSYFAWGTRWHDVMFEWHNTFDVGKTLEVLHEGWPQELNEFDKKNRTEQRMESIFYSYAKRYAEQDVDDWETIRREMYFDVECPLDSTSCPLHDGRGCDLRWCGRLDRISRDHRGRIYVWDYKTTSYKRADYYEQHKHGVQMPGYTWAAMHLTPEPVKGVYIDLLHTLKNEFNMERREIRFTRQHLLEWVHQARMIVGEMQEKLEQHLHNPQAWTKNWNHCSDYAGCMYRPVHFMAPIGDVRWRALNDDYVVDRWDPADLVNGD